MKKSIRAVGIQESKTRENEKAALEESRTSSRDVLARNKESSVAIRSASFPTNNLLPGWLCAAPKRKRGICCLRSKTETESGSFLQTTALIETDLNYAPANIKY